MTTRIQYQGTLESIDYPVYTDADPTGTTPKFQLAAVGASPVGSWVAGTWKGAYDADADTATATTPTLGSSGAGLTIATDTTYVLWGQFTVGTEVFVRKVDTLEVA